MSSKDSKFMAIAFVAVFIVASFSVMSFDGELAKPEDISLSPSTSAFTLRGGESKTIYLDICNKIDRPLVVYIDLVNAPDLSISFPEEQRIEVKGGEVGYCKAIISTDMYAPSNIVSLSFEITVNDPERGAPIKFIESNVILVTIQSNYGSENYINKFLGFVDNNMEGILAESWFSAFITLVAYMLISLFISFKMFPYLVKRLRNRSWFNQMFPPRDLAFEADKILFIGCLLITLFMTMRVYGLDERAVGVLYTVMTIYLIIVIGATIWNMYSYVLNKALGWFDDDITDGSTSSLYSLLQIIGKILIFAGSLMAILVTAGVESTAAALVSAAFGLAISFGAQSTVEQLFSGLVILTTRPFSVGDVIRIEGLEDDLRVVKIGLMNSKFREWNSLETHNIPNSQLAKSRIVNITAEKKAYVMQMYFDVPYHTDFRLLKEIALEAASRVDHIILHEDEYKPGFELNKSSLSDMIEFKFLFYIDDFNEHDDVTSDVREIFYKILNDRGINTCTCQDISIKD